MCQLAHLQTYLYHIFLGRNLSVRPLEGGEVEFPEAAHTNGLAQHPLLLDCVGENLSSGQGVWQQESVRRSSVELACVITDFGLRADIRLRLWLWVEGSCWTIAVIVGGRRGGRTLLG